jgi:hypothetical protein
MASVHTSFSPAALITASHTASAAAFVGNALNTTGTIPYLQIFVNYGRQSLLPWTHSIKVAHACNRVPQSASIRQVLLVKHDLHHMPCAPISRFGQRICHDTALYVVGG